MFPLQAASVVLLFLLAVHICRADYYSAVTSLSDLWEAESYTLHRFEMYMEAEQNKHLQMELFLSEVEMEMAEAGDNALAYYGNPIKALKAIKRLARDWPSYFQYNSKLTNEQAYTESMKTLDKLQFKRPVYEDLLGASKGIARLQQVYKLDTSQFANGTIMGQKISREMLASDCFHLGASLAHAEDFKHAASWLLEARARLGQEMSYQSESEHRQFPVLNDEKILEYLVPATIRTGNIKLGHWLAREQLERNASNEKASESLKFTQQKLLEERFSLVQQITSSLEIGMEPNAAEEQRQDNKVEIEEIDREPKEADIKKLKGDLEKLNEDNLELEADEEEYAEEYDEENIAIGFEIIDENTELDGGTKPAEIDHLKGKDGKIPSMEMLYEQTCRGDIKPTSAEQRPLRCRYQHNNVPFCQLARFKVEELSLDPYVAIYYEVIYESEIAKIIEQGEATVVRSKVGNDEVQSTVSEVRTSKNTWLWYNEHDFLSTIRGRLADITGLSLETAEALQVANYGIGGHYGPHYDFSEDDKFDYGGVGNRILTALFYINHVKMGGSTAFPYLRLAVPPVRRSLVMWYNMHPSLELDYRTKHAACPVILGSKWICNEWFHEVGQEFLRPCSLQQNGYKSIKYKEIESI